MTKTLTEQWYDDTIDRSHHYYVRIKGKEEMGCGGIDFIDIIRPPLFRDQVDKLLQYNDPEVLAPVPSYEENNELVQKMNILKKQLEVALEVFGIIAMHSKDPVDAVQAACAISQIKEMEGVK